MKQIKAKCNKTGKVWDFIKLPEQSAIAYVNRMNSDQAKEFQKKINCDYSYFIG